MKRRSLSTRLHGVTSQKAERPLSFFLWYGEHLPWSMTGEKLQWKICFVVKNTHEMCFISTKCSKKEVRVAVSKWLQNFKIHYFYWLYSNYIPSPPFARDCWLYIVTSKKLLVLLSLYQRLRRPVPTPDKRQLILDSQWQRNRRFHHYWYVLQHIWWIWNKTGVLNFADSHTK